LGNWQFACFNYYHPPKGIDFRCVRAEPYVPVLANIVERIQNITRAELPERDIPRNWKLNTCLVNYYGSKLEGGRWVDGARVGEHKDFEPGPVASLSFGDRAMFQFVSSRGKGAQSEVVRQMWLDHNSLQIFGGEVWKKKYFHRVQRVEKKSTLKLAPAIEGFQTRRINLTFRYVPEEHIQPFYRFPPNLRDDVRSYMALLAGHSLFFKEALASEARTL
jgi:alkylated DNA repair dioxygenase AlkB